MTEKKMLEKMSKMIPCNQVVSYFQANCVVLFQTAFPQILQLDFNLLDNIMFPVVERVSRPEKFCWVWGQGYIFGGFAEFAGGCL